MGNPMRAKSVRWPKAPEDQREAWPLETALRVRDAIGPRYRIAAVVALGCGLRQGGFGLSPEDVDFARGALRIRRQVQLLHGRLYFALPKGGKTRVVDMPPSVASELAAYFLEYPAVEVELPWGGPEADREGKKFPLVLTTTYGNALRANIFNVEVWKPVLAAAGVIPMRDKGERWKASRKDGFHVLRHTYASVILDAGESVATLARWLGHSSPTITLDYYAHFMPEAGGKGRGAIDALLNRTAPAIADG
ncbi:tyrosine-type recombinase/integrase [Streptomyces sp. R39]|uniref:Tyrosine-type recombinase/integrase n=1 Tax=Streptomyces sp. R39 TaxID=3238631 RepID=A0AB39QZ76_9ACTN